MNSCARISCIRFAPMLMCALLLASVSARAESDRLNAFLRVAGALLANRAALTEDFEAPQVANYTVYRAGQAFKTRNNTWQVESGSVDHVNATLRTEVAAFDGKQLVELAGSPGPGVVATQFSTRAGQTYSLAIHYARNSGLGRNVARATVEVLGGANASLLQAALQHDPSQLAFNAQSTYTGTFVADGTRATLRLTSLNAGNYGLTVDGIAIAPAAGVAAGSTDAAAAGVQASAGKAEDRPTFMVRCKRETIALYAGAAKQADSICGSKWDMVTASAPMVDAMLAVAPATGARFDAAAARGQATGVRWSAKPNAGQIASGRVKDIQVGLANSPAPRISFEWFKNGDTIPFDLPEALKVRGLGVSMIGCFSFGAGEGGHVYRLQAPDKAPFSVAINFRNAAVASQSSTFAAAADFSSKLATLASLKRDGNDWSATCPE